MKQISELFVQKGMNDSDLRKEIGYSLSEYIDPVIESIEDVEIIIEKCKKMLSRDSTYLDHLEYNESALSLLYKKLIPYKSVIKEWRQDIYKKLCDEHAL
jgi:hypothetical protein